MVNPMPNAEGLSLGSIREVYRELLQLGEANHAQRAPATTPLEHLPSLQNSLEPEDVIEHLTTAYIGARYAEQEASRQEVAAARQQLERLHTRTP
jgi:hypothetical protein